MEEIATLTLAMTDTREKIAAPDGLAMTNNGEKIAAPDGLAMTHRGGVGMMGCRSGVKRAEKLLSKN